MVDSKHKAGDKYCNLLTEEKFAFASYNNPNELLNHSLEILHVCGHKIVCLLSGLSMISFFFLIR